MKRDSIHIRNLKEINTFGIDMDAEVFIASDLKSLQSFLSDNSRPYYILGGGSNVLFTSGFDSLVIKNELKGITIIEDNDKDVLLSIASGEVWHDLVLWTLDNGYYGLENLSLIPGTVGAAPIQNIGAYGIELADVLSYVEYIDLTEFTIKKCSKEDCQLGYRDSIFKRELKGNFYMTNVVIRLSKVAEINAGYGAIQKQLEEQGIQTPTPKDISNIIIDIREQKLPDPKEIGNAGSFFKNVVVPQKVLVELKYFYQDIPHYPTENGYIKIPTAWLIDQCDWKGKRIGNVGVHEQHALVLVNYGGGTGEDIIALAKDIQTSVWEKFGIEITPEVNFVF